MKFDPEAGRLTLPRRGGGAASNRYVGQWRWPAAAAPFDRMAAAYRGGLEAYRQLHAKADEIAADAMLSDTGKREKLKGWAVQTLAPAVAGLRAAARDAAAHAEARKGEAKVAGADRGDLAAAILRSEIRSWLRTMKASDRGKLLGPGGDTDPAIVAAILEAPHQLSGVAAATYERLQAAELDRQHPGLREELAELGEASETLGHLDRALRDEANMVAGVTTADLRPAVAMTLSPPRLFTGAILGTGEKRIMVRDPEHPHGQRFATDVEIAAGTFENEAPGLRSVA